MTKELTILLLAAFFVGSCGGQISPRLEPSAGNDSIYFLVVDETLQPIEHAAVFLVAEGEVELFANRNGDGLIVGSRRQLLSRDNGALLVCAEGYYCGGWVLDDLEVEAIKNPETAKSDLKIVLTPVRLW